MLDLMDLYLEDDPMSKVSWKQQLEITKQNTDPSPEDKRKSGAEITTIQDYLL